MTIEPKIKQLKQKKDDIWDEFNKLKEIVNAKYAEIDKVKKEE